MIKHKKFVDERGYFAEIYRKNTFSKLIPKFNLKQIDVIGQPFDPHLHEALTYVASDEFEEGICTEQVRKGYQFGDKLLRAAQVVVSSGKDTKENS